MTNPVPPITISESLEPIDFGGEQWLFAYQRLEELIRNTEEFPALVNAMAGYPKGNVRRARVLSNKILTALGLSDAYRGNVFGAAITAHQERALLDRHHGPLPKDI